MNRTYILKAEKVQSVLDKSPLGVGQLAHLLGVHRNTVQRWLSGKTRHIKYENAQRMAHCLGLEISDIAKTRHQTGYRVKLDYDPSSVLLESNWLWSLLADEQHIKLESLLHVVLESSSSLQDILTIYLFLAESALDQEDIAMCMRYLEKANELNKKVRDTELRDQVDLQLSLIDITITLLKTKFKSAAARIDEIFIGEGSDPIMECRYGTILTLLDYWRGVTMKLTFPTSAEVSVSSVWERQMMRLARDCCFETVAPH